MKLEAAIARVKKLRALAKSSNPHEATLAKSQAEKLMGEHGLKESDVLGVGEADVKEWPILNVNFKPDWRLGLLTAVAMRYGCKALRVIEDRNRSSGMVVGPKDVAMIVVQVFTYFEDAVRKRADAYVNERDAQEQAELTKKPGKPMKPKADWLMQQFAEEVERTIQKQPLLDHEMVFDSFCRGATINLQERVLHGEMEVNLDLGPENPIRVEIIGKEVVKVKDTAVAQRLSDDYMKNRAAEKTTGRGYAEDREAFFRGKIAGREIPLLGKDAPK